MTGTPPNEDESMNAGTTSHRPMLCAFDIETDTTGGGGLDPRTAGIVSIAASTSCGVDFFDSARPGSRQDEARLLLEFDRWLLDVKPDRLVTWNGAVFDGPFIDSRARLLGVELGLVLTLDPGIEPKYEPCPGYEGGYRIEWHGVDHDDVAYLWRTWCSDSNVRWSLKACAEANSIDAISVDRQRIHDLSWIELRDYNLSDTAATLALASGPPVRAS